MATSVWRGHISFGLVSIPVRLFRAARAERVKLREVYAVAPEPGPEVPRARGPIAVDRPTNTASLEEPAMQIAPVRRVVLDDSGEQVPQSAVTKGYEIAKGQFVTIDREELKTLTPKTSTTMELVEFVSLASVDPVYFETSYYVQPEPAGEKAYALLYRSLQATGLVGVAQIAMHRREHIVLVRSGKSGLIAHTMYFTSEVRADQEYKAEATLVNPKELEMANTLVRALAADFAPEKFRDTYREQFEKMIEAKAAGKQVLPGRSEAPSKPAVDIMDALRKSLEGIKKPPEPVRERTERSRRRRS